MYYLLWFDNDVKKTTTQKILDAAAYYQEKYGKVATKALVHPSMMPVIVEGMTVEATRAVQPNHVLVGHSA